MNWIPEPIVKFILEKVVERYWPSAILTERRKLYIELTEDIMSALDSAKVVIEDYTNTYTHRHITTDFIESKKAKLLQHGSDEVVRLFLAYQSVSHSAKGLMQEDTIAFMWKLLITMKREINPSTNITDDEIAEYVFDCTSTMCHASSRYSEYLEGV